MKLKLTALTFACVLISLTSLAQKNLAKIDSSYVNYFQDTRETPYLHLNKTSFLSGEEIWFSAYVIEQNSQRPHPTTSNLYISIFDASGNLKDQQLVHVKKGLGYGSINIDSTFTKDHYYLKASTKWMKNFKEDQSFSQKIKIVSSPKKKITESTKSEKDYFEFKLFPEGGHLVANTINNVGILIKNANNKGQKIQKGVIKDEQGNILKTFITNHLGFGKVKLFFSENSTYTFEATLENGSIVFAKTPKISSQGISLQVENNESKQLKINIGTNENTLKRIAGKKYTVVVHNTRTYLKYALPINSSMTNYSLLLRKEQLPKGMNIITVFNEQSIPLVERLIFINDDTLYSNVSIDKTFYGKDSINISFENKSSESVFLSASFLPHETKAYNPKHSIRTAILLKPYIKGDIENFQYYFLKNDRKRRVDLDLLLLTQGWSKYSWDHIFNAPPKLYNPFEYGIDITTNVNKRLNKKQTVLMYSPENKLVREIKNLESSYILKNSFIKKNSIINFALKSKTGLFKITPVMSYSNSSLSDSFAPSTTFLEKSELEISNFKDLSKDIEVLDEVVVKAAKKREYENDAYGLNTMLLGIKMENLIISSGETVFDFLRLRGYNIYTTVNGNVVIGARGISNLGSRGLGAQSSGDENFAPAEQEEENLFKTGVRVFLNGEEVSQNLWIVENIYLNTVKEIFYGRNHDNRSSEQVHIFTLSPLEYDVRRAEYTKVKLPIGFAVEKKYYSPKYPTFFDDTYKNYGAIFWKPNVVIKESSKTSITVPTHLQDAFNIYIEGVSESGKLISIKKTIELKN
ncbi:hypothetical protein RQM59_08875 [Flavobacteriaceae bacterium S356]|uniref:Uncharacterized protein n=1 Tax=Asprobacillus argus TaxID=3076534 RepID=A0ABU3LFG8_9FLAO|nr:hypothetical protein [Flavobacteriaceae bacterium S356]